MISSVGWVHIDELVHLCTASLRVAASVVVSGPICPGEDRLTALSRVATRFVRIASTQRCEAAGGSPLAGGRIVVESGDCSRGPDRTSSVVCGSVLEALQLVRLVLAGPASDPEVSSETDADDREPRRVIIDVITQSCRAQELVGRRSSRVISASVV